MQIRAPRTLPAIVGTAALVTLASAPGAQSLTTETVVDEAFLPSITWVGSPPGDERIFVCEKTTGEVRIIDGSGTLLPTPFLDVPVSIQTFGEQGLLGMAFHPKFEQNGYVYVNYSATGGSANLTTIDRFTVSASDPNQVDPASRFTILETNQPFSNHNAGDLDFSPVDGYLYVPIGDGGSGNDPGCRSQNPSNLKGKLIRIDVDNQDAGLNYAIPADNPFVGDPDVRDEIWAFGLRNPWRFAFDSLTGDLYFGDVGQGSGSSEEINFEAAGAGGQNYGWPVRHGTVCNNAGVNNCTGKPYDVPACNDPSLTDPVIALATYGGGNCSMVGGEVYRGCAVPDLQGVYFFADYCSGRYYRIEMAGGVATNFTEISGQLNGAGGSPVAFGTDGDGEILIANFNGRISRVVPASPPVIADCDGNGQDDACEIATVAWADMDGSGVVDACEDFSVDTDSVCVSLGGTQNMSLHAGAANGGKTYLVLGSLSGTAPGLPLGPVTVPLNIDAYFTITVTGANNGAPFQDTFGTLDGQGEASAAFSAPAGLLPASAVGLTASHAFVLFDGGNNVEFASNTTALTFEP